MGIVYHTAQAPYTSTLHQQLTPAAYTSTSTLASVFAVDSSPLTPGLPPGLPLGLPPGLHQARINYAGRA